MTGTEPLSHSGASRVEDDVEASDADLVERLRRAESAAFSICYARYRAPIFGFLARLGGDRHVAEDLSQEVWLRLARHATRLRPDTRLAAWLFTVARRLYLSHRRWSVVEAVRRLGWAQRTRALESSETPYDVASGHETERRLEVALQGVPLPYREVLLLVAVQQLDTAEVGRVLGLSNDAVRQRLTRARSMLAQALKGGGQ